MIGKFTEWLLENTDLLNEANSTELFKNTMSWPRHEKNNISQTFENFNIYPVINWLSKKFESIIAFKYPDYGLRGTNKDNTKTTNTNAGFNGLYIIVDNAHASRPSRKELYNEIFEKLGNINVNKSEGFYLSYGDTENAKEYVNYTSIINDEEVIQKWNLSKNILDKESPTACVLYIGVYKKINKQFILNNVVGIRIVGDTSTENKPRMVIQEANSILTGVFGNGIKNLYNDNAVNKNGVNIKNFGEDVINSVNSIITTNKSLEKECYELIFSKTPNKKFDASKDWKDIKLSNDVSLIKYINVSNIDKVLSELLIPWLLVNGVKIINGVDVISKINENKNAKITNINWPDSQNNKFTDYSICFFNDGKKVGISAKGREGGNNGTIISILVNNLNTKLVNRTDILFDNIINNMRYCAKEFKMTNMKYGWVIGATCAAYNLNIELSNEDLESLIQLFNNLLINKNIVTYKNIRKTLSSNIQTIFDKLYEERKYINAANKNVFLYSLTQIFEMVSKNVLNANNKTKGCIYKLKFKTIEENIGMKFYQIELKPNSRGFELAIRENKSSNKRKSLEELGKLLNIRAKGSNGLNLKYVTGQDCVKILTQTGVGNGQILGAEFTNSN